MPIRWGREWLREWHQLPPTSVFIKRTYQALCVTLCQLIGTYVCPGNSRDTTGILIYLLRHVQIWVQNNKSVSWGFYPQICVKVVRCVSTRWLVRNISVWWIGVLVIPPRRILYMHHTYRDNWCPGNPCLNKLVKAHWSPYKPTSRSLVDGISL